MSDFTLPTSRRITQPYGAEFDDWDGDGIVDYPGGFYHSIGWDGHNGIDYACGLGDPIEAVADGYVAFAAWAGNHWLLSGGGNAILIEHRAHGVQTEYLHLSRFATAAGQWVSKGQVIGYAGKTGAATGYHLHLGMLPLTSININNRMRGRIDPTPYLYGGIAAQGTITTQEDEDLTPEQFNLLVGKIDELNAAHHVATREHVNGKIPDIASAVWTHPIDHRNLAGGLEPDATTPETVLSYVDFNNEQNRLATASPTNIAAQINAAGIAAAVRDELVKLLGGK